MIAVIMAGGKGTRIASVTNDEIPKPMLTIGGKPILEHQIACLKNNGVTDIIIVIGHLGSKISDYFGNGKKFGVKIDYIEENESRPLGTAGSLFYLKNKIKDDFILVFGDVFFDIDFRRMTNFHKANHAIATLLTHPNSHPYDSDLVVVDNESRVTGFDSKENDRSKYDYRNIVNSGIYVLSARTLDTITAPEKLSLEKDVIVKYINQGTVFSYHSTEYVKDMGTPERYNSVNRDYDNNLPEKKNLKHQQKCIFLDRDGTINQYRGLLTDTNDLALINGSAKAIRMINDSEYLCIVITNQPIIARGDSSIENLDNIHKRLETLLGREGAYIDDLYYCPHHPDKGFDGEVVELKIDCDCRKPKTGMITRAQEKYNINLAESFMIGDSTLDVKLAENAGMKSILLETGVSGEDGKYKVKPTFRRKDLLDAVQNILNEESAQ